MQNYQTLFPIIQVRIGLTFCRNLQRIGSESLPPFCSKMWPKLRRDTRCLQLHTDELWTKELCGKFFRNSRGSPNVTFITGLDDTLSSSLMQAFTCASCVSKPYGGKKSCIINITHYTIYKSCTKYNCFLSFLIKQMNKDNTEFRVRSDIMGELTDLKRNILVWREVKEKKIATTFTFSWCVIISVFMVISQLFLASLVESMLSYATGTVKKQTNIRTHGPYISIYWKVWQIYLTPAGLMGL